MKKKLWILGMIDVFLIYHMSRDLMQIWGWKWWYTEIGHELGVAASEKFWSIFQLSYGIWTEWVAVGMELILIVLITRKIVKLNKRIVFQESKNIVG